MPNQFTKKPRKKYKHPDAYYAAYGERILNWYFSQPKPSAPEPIKTYRDIFKPVENNRNEPELLGTSSVIQ